MKKHLTLLLTAGLALSGCVFDSDSGNSTSGSSSATGFKIFALGTLYSSGGGTAALDRVSNDTSLATKLLTLASSDALLDRDSANGVLYLIQRSNAVVTGFKSSDLSQPTLDVNVGSGSNPYAVASLSGKLWVACYGSAYLKAVDLTTGKLVDSIDLSAYADTTGKNTNPFAMAVHAWNGKLAVVLGRLKSDWTPNDSSLVVVVDPDTKKEVERIALPWKNAYGAAWSGDSLLVACVGSWYSYTDGGLALVNLAHGTATALVSETTAGGNISSASFGPAATGFVGVTDASYATSVWTVDLSSEVLTKVSGTFNVGSFAWDGRHLWLGTASSTLVRATSSGTVLATFSTTLSPTSLAVLP